jgi:hypothetical protein
VTLVENAQAESPLKEVTANRCGEVLHARVPAAGRAERPGKRGLSGRYGNTMDMIGHETPHENGYTMPRDSFAEHPEILRAILLRTKHVYRANTTLGNMVRIAGDQNARQTSHRAML